MSEGKNTTRNINDEVADIIMELPQSFSVGGRRFCLFPMSLGKSYYISRLIGKLGIDQRILQLNPYVEALRITAANTSGVCRILACHTAADKDELYSEAKMLNRSNFMMKHLSKQEIAELFTLTLSEPPITDIYRHLGIADDHKRRELVMAAKTPDSNTFTFGGKSVFGALIAPACEKLGMTPRQVVWGISLRFLQTLMADMVTQVYLSDEELKKCRIPADGAASINADDPASLALIRNISCD